MSETINAPDPELLRDATTQELQSFLDEKLVLLVPCMTLRGEFGVAPMTEANLPSDIIGQLAWTRTFISGEDEVRISVIGSSAAAVREAGSISSATITKQALYLEVEERGTEERYEIYAVPDENTVGTFAEHTFWRTEDDTICYGKSSEEDREFVRKLLNKPFDEMKAVAAERRQQLRHIASITGIPLEQFSVRRLNDLGTMVVNLAETCIPPLE